MSNTESTIDRWLREGAGSHDRTIALLNELGTHLGERPYLRLSPKQEGFIVCFDECDADGGTRIIGRGDDEIEALAAAFAGADLYPACGGDGWVEGEFGCRPCECCNGSVLYQCEEADAPCTLSELVAANAETFTREDIAALRAMQPGDVIGFDIGGGASIVKAVKP